MSELGDTYKDYHEIKKELREKRNDKWSEVLESIGAKELSDGVWRKDNWDFYPYKGGARNYRTGQRARIESAIKQVTEDTNA